MFVWLKWFRRWAIVCMCYNHRHRSQCGCVRPTTDMNNLQLNKFSTDLFLTARIYHEKKENVSLAHRPPTTELCISGLHRWSERLLLFVWFSIRLALDNTAIHCSYVFGVRTIFTQVAASAATFAPLKSISIYSHITYLYTENKKIKK